MHESMSIQDGAFLDGKCKRTDKRLKARNPGLREQRRVLRALENLRLISGCR